MATKTEPGRNDPCPCGSGKKYKKCCIDRYGKNGYHTVYCYLDVKNLPDAEKPTATMYERHTGYKATVMLPNFYIRRRISRLREMMEKDSNLHTQLITPVGCNVVVLWGSIRAWDGTSMVVEPITIGVGDVKFKDDTEDPSVS